MLSRLRSTNALTVYVPPAIYSAGSTIAGEVELDFRHLQEEKIDEVQVRLRGASKTMIHRDKAHAVETIVLVRDDAHLWHRGGAYPDPGSDILRLPFALQLPEQLPPSFHYRSIGLDKSAAVRYSLSAVGVRKGLLSLNKRHRVPLAVLPRDEVGAQIRAENATHAMRTFPAEDKIRKGLWGDYSSVHVELALPAIAVLPLFSDIPYTVTVRTTSAPTARAKADAHPPDKPVFPPVPLAPDDLEFALRRQLKIRAKYMRASASGDVLQILGGKEKERMKRTAPVEADVASREWLPLGADGQPVDGEKGKEGQSEDPEAKGVWVQRATFHSTFSLSCPPAFALHNVECSYQLVVKVPFPGIGNDLKLEVPVHVTSGIDKPVPREPPPADGEGVDRPPPALDLPPAYWDANDNEWGDDDKA